MFLSLLIISTVISFILVIVSSLATPNSFLDRFSGKLSALLFLYLALGVFLTYNLQETALDDMQRQATLHVNEKSGMGVNKIIADNYQNCPNFCQSLYFDWQKENLGWKKTDIKESDEWQAVMYITFSLIQAMEDVLVVLGVDTTELSAWVATFIQWCHSPKFRQAWQPFKTIYNKKTAEFIDLIISKTPDDNQIKNKEELFELATKIRNGKELRDILSK